MGRKASEQLFLAAWDKRKESLRVRKPDISLALFATFQIDGNAVSQDSDLQGTSILAPMQQSPVFMRVPCVVNAMAVVDSVMVSEGRRRRSFASGSCRETAGSPRASYGQASKSFE